MCVGRGNVRPNVQTENRYAGARVWAVVTQRYNRHRAWAWGGMVSKGHTHMGNVGGVGACMGQAPGTITRLGRGGGTHNNRHIKWDSQQAVGNAHGACGGG